MKAEENMSPQELGEKGHYGNNGEWIPEIIAEPDEELPRHLPTNCENCGEKITIKESYLHDGLCSLCYENEMLGLTYGE